MSRETQTRAESRPPRTGPERFWSNRWARVVGAVSLAVSLIVHYELSPWSFFPQRSLEFKDTEGEITIPIDMIEGPTPPEPPPPVAPPPPTPASPAKTAEGAGHGIVDAGAPRLHRDAGGAPGPDGGANAERAAELAKVSSRDRIVDGGAGGGDASAPLAWGGDGGSGDGVMAGPTLVEIRVNIAVVRLNPVGARMGPILLGIPQWEDFLGGTDVDPVKDLEWIWIFGPSLIHTEKDAAVLRYNMTDERAARNIAILSKHDVGGGKFDAGVPGVRAWRGRADNAWRVFMLPKPHIAAMVPPDFAKVAATAFSRVELRTPTGPKEAVRVMVKNPSHPMPFLPTSLTELRFWAVPHDGGGADAYVEADSRDAEAAEVAARQIRQLVQQQNSIGVKIVTRGLLNDFEVTSEGAMVKGHLQVSQEQLEALYDLVAAFLGVDSTGTAPSGSSPTPAIPPRAPAPPRPTH
ncbi:MAG: hypothetical protein ACLQVI_00980 [Polyangiaceae bacterium]